MDHNQKKHSIFRMNASMVLPALLVALTLCVIQCTVAYLMVTDQKINTFSIGNVDGEIIETFAPNGEGEMIKENVRVRNNGGITAYIRTVVSIYWVDQDGMILPDLPVSGTDYEMTWGEKWLERDGIYYYPDPIKKNESTAPLLSSCRQIKDYDDQRILVVDIATQAIQANPSSAVSTAWNVTVNTTTYCIELPE